MENQVAKIIRRLISDVREPREDRRQLADKMFQKWAYYRDYYQDIVEYIDESYLGCSLEDYQTRKAYRQVLDKVIVFKKIKADLIKLLKTYQERLNQIEKYWEQGNWSKVIYLARQETLILESHKITPEYYLLQLGEKFEEYCEAGAELRTLCVDLERLDWQTWYLKSRLSEIHSICQYWLDDRTINDSNVDRALIRVFQELWKRASDKEAVLAEVSHLYQQRCYGEAANRIYEYNHQELTEADVADYLISNKKLVEYGCGAERIVGMVDCIECGRPYEI